MKVIAVTAVTGVTAVTAVIAVTGVTAVTAVTGVTAVTALSERRQLLAYRRSSTESAGVPKEHPHLISVSGNVLRCWTGHADGAAKSSCLQQAAREKERKKENRESEKEALPVRMSGLVSELHLHL